MYSILEYHYKQFIQYKDFNNVKKLNYKEDFDKNKVMRPHKMLLIIVNKFSMKLNKLHV